MAEAREYLTLAIDHLDRVPPNAGRNRQEMALRLQRGMLVGAAEGAGSTAWASDLERCLQLGGTDLNDDKLFAALNTLTIYDINRGELRRAEPIVAFVEPRRPSIPMGGAWGVMALFGGQLDVARPLIEQWKFDLALASQEFEDSWIVPFDYRAAACVGLGALRLL